MPQQLRQRGPGRLADHLVGAVVVRRRLGVDDDEPGAVAGGDAREAGGGLDLEAAADGDEDLAGLGDGDGLAQSDMAPRGWAAPGGPAAPVCR
ncbi:hypothetical protein GCM10020295_14760 [Streptomyces cinereospinus]